MPATTLELVPPPDALEAPGSSEGWPAYHVSLALYERMIEAGVFDKEPVFLWRRRLVQKMTKGQNHGKSMAGLAANMWKVVPEGWHVRIEQSVMLSDDSMPEPDLCVVRGQRLDYRSRRVVASDLALVIEVSESSLRADSGPMLRQYASEGVPIYWLVNVRDDRVDIYTRPSGLREAGPAYYMEKQIIPRGQNLSLVLDGREIGRLPVSESLP